MAGMKRKLQDLSMDEFMSGAFDSSSSESEKKAKSVGKKNIKNKKNISKTTVKEKKSLKERLKDQDPEFLKFLQEEDEALLDMEDDVSDSDEDEADTDDDDSDNGDSEEEDDIDLPDSSDDEVETPRKKLKTKEKKKLKKLDPAKTKEKKEPMKADAAKTKDKKSLKRADAAKQTEKAKDCKKEKKLSQKDAKAQNKGTSKEMIAEEAEDSDESDEGDEEITAEDFSFDDPDSDDDDDVYRPPDKLEEMNEPSDSDEEEEDVDQKKRGKGVKVTITMIQQWTKRFKELPSPALLHEAIHAFKAAVQQTAAEGVTTKYKVIGSKVFNAVVKMCLVEIPQALHKILDLPMITDLQKPVLPTRSNQKWEKIKLNVRLYLKDILQLLSSLSQANMVDVLLKHIHKLVAFYACFPKLTKKMLKKAISIWSTGEETSRVLAFLIINRQIRLQQNVLLEHCLKQMYMAYVKNCKFTSPNSLPLINFMQRSFVEVFSLDFALAYQYAFIYIRQLAIHLRNAISTKKKESCQAVYNWQFIHCLGLWVQLLSTTHPNEVLEPLVYPLTQTIIGTIKLVPNQRYYPLRFHCVRHLTMLSKSTGTFIPVLPFLLEIFEQTDFNKKHKAVSFKPLNFTCALKLSKVQVQERSFKDGLVDQLYELLLEHFNVHAHTIGFPELALPSMLQLKDFLKKCKVGNFTKQFKQIVEKVEENCKFITNRRRTTTIALSDIKAIEAWERQCQEAGTPLGKFYATWRKLRDREMLHVISQKDTIVGEYKLPEITKPKGIQKATEEDKKEFSAIFDETDSEDETDLADRFLSKKEKKVKEKAKKKEEAEKDSDSDYSDFDDDEFEQLAGSGDDDDDEDKDMDSSSDDQDDDVDSNSDEGEQEDSDDLDAKKDIVKDFSLSSDEESE